MYYSLLFKAKRYYQEIAIGWGVILLTDFVVHDWDWFLKRGIRKRLKEKGVLNEKYLEALSIENVEKLLETKNQSYKVNVVYGPSGVGKTSALMQFAHIRGEQKRPVAVIRIGKVGNDTTECDLAREIVDAIGIPHGNSYYFKSRRLLVSIINKIFGLTEPESVVPERVDYAIKLLFGAVQDSFAEEKEELRYKVCVRPPKGFKKPTDDWDTCRPVLIVDEGDDGAVSTPGHDVMRREIMKKFARRLIQDSSKFKNFEAWMCGHDAQLLAECCDKYRNTKFPVTKFNVIELGDPSLAHYVEGANKHNLIDRKGRPLLYDAAVIGNITRVLGTRVEDFVALNLHQRFHTAEEVASKVNARVAKVTAPLAALLKGCMDPAEREQLHYVLDKCAFGRGAGNNEVQLSEVPPSVKASPHFSDVFHVAEGTRVTLQRPALQHAWKVDSRANSRFVDRNPKKSSGGWWFW